MREEGVGGERSRGGSGGERRRGGGGGREKKRRGRGREKKRRAGEERAAMDNTGELVLSHFPAARMLSVARLSGACAALNPTLNPALISALTLLTGP